jgi:curli biogenesis system outer membrane secretion channel CsgG
MSRIWYKKGVSFHLLLIGYLLLVSCATMPGQPVAQATHVQGPSVGEVQMQRYDGPRARIAVGDFQVKAAGATHDIGDGLREMLLTALFNSDYFIVLERQAINEIMLEQDLGASGRVKRETAAPIGELEGAEILVYGVVSEFESQASGGGLRLSMPRLPFSFGGDVSNAHIGIDLRAVDTATGRILFASRVEGKASDFSARVGTAIGGGKTRMPISLGAYNNTPMEKAIRVAIDTAVGYLVSKTPRQYFHFR